MHSEFAATLYLQSNIKFNLFATADEDFARVNQHRWRRGVRITQQLHRRVDQVRAMHLTVQRQSIGAPHEHGSEVQLLQKRGVAGECNSNGRLRLCVHTDGFRCGNVQPVDGLLKHQPVYQLEVIVDYTGCVRVERIIRSVSVQQARGQPPYVEHAVLTEVAHTVSDIKVKGSTPSERGAHVSTIVRITSSDGVRIHGVVGVQVHLVLEIGNSIRVIDYSEANDVLLGSRNIQMQGRG